jgi:uncharacterized protein (DUF1778 family)
MKKKRVRTKSPMLYGNFRLKQADRELWIKAATKADETLSEFMRNALRERAAKVLAIDAAKAA